MWNVAWLILGFLPTAYSFEQDASAPGINATRRMLAGLTRDEELACQQYANRTYVPTAQQKHPTVLWTFPGSGSGWVRLLIEPQVSRCMHCFDVPLHFSSLCF